MKNSLQREIDEWLGKEVNITKPSKPVIHSTFFDMVDDMVAYNKQRRNELPAQIARSMHVVDYAMEHCTIKVSAGRQTGKTEYIKQRVDKDSLVIVPNRNMIKMFPPNKYDVVDVQFMKQELAFYGREKYKTVYIDEPHFLFREVKEHMLYRNLVDHTYDQTFILLGA